MTRYIVRWIEVVEAPNRDAILERPWPGPTASVTSIERVDDDEALRQLAGNSRYVDEELEFDV